MKKIAWRHQRSKEELIHKANLYTSIKYMIDKINACDSLECLNSLKKEILIITRDKPDLFQLIHHVYMQKLKKYKRI